MKVKKCAEPGCSELLSDTRGSTCRCPEHQLIPFQTASRSNEILYRTPEWKILRNRIIDKFLECKICRSTTHLEVDHIIPPRGNRDLFFDEDNLQVLCTIHHRLKTNEEISSRR